MTQYNSLNVNLLNLQLNKLKSAIKNETDIVLRLSSDIIGDPGFYPSNFVYSCFSPKIQFLYCLLNSMAP